MVDAGASKARPGLGRRPGRRPRPRRPGPGPPVRRRRDDVVPGAGLARARPPRRRGVRAPGDHRQAGAAGGRASSTPIRSPRCGRTARAGDMLRRGQPRPTTAVVQSAMRRAGAWGLTTRVDRCRAPPRAGRGRPRAVDRRRRPAAPRTTGGWCCATTCSGSSRTCASSTRGCSRRPTGVRADDGLHHLLRRGRLAEVVDGAGATARPRSARPRGRDRSTRPSSARCSPATSCSSTPARPSPSLEDGAMRA